MVVTLEWIRDHYDNNPKNRYIDGSELSMAVFDESRRTITREQLDAVHDAYYNHVLLPDYDVTVSIMSASHVISFNVPNGAKLEVDGVEAI